MFWFGGAHSIPNVRAPTYSADRLSFFQDLLSLVDLLSAEPEIARLRSEFNPPMRLRIYSSHIVIYETAETGIVVMRVLHL